MDRSGPSLQLLFGTGDLVATLVQRGLVVNAAKYLAGQPVVAPNPDPKRIDGALDPALRLCEPASGEN